jgi:hypothetical protein
MCLYVYVCLCVCVCVCVYLCVCMSMYVCLYVYVCLCMCVPMCLCIYVCESVCMCACLSISISMCRVYQCLFAVVDPCTTTTLALAFIPISSHSCSLSSPMCSAPGAFDITDTHGSVHGRVECSGPQLEVGGSLCVESSVHARSVRHRIGSGVRSAAGWHRC